MVTPEARASLGTLGYGLLLALWGSWAHLITSYHSLGTLPLLSLGEILRSLALLSPECGSSGALVLPPPFSMSFQWYRGHSHDLKVFFLPNPPICSGHPLCISCRGSTAAGAGSGVNSTLQPLGVHLLPTLLALSSALVRFCLALELQQGPVLFRFIHSLTLICSINIY